MAADDVEKSADGSTAVAFRTILVVYGVAIFLSAALLFAVQPIFTKMVLPKLGGSAAVWSVAMVFFQTVLLAGYAYAHLLTRYVPTRYAVIIHVAVMRRGDLGVAARHRRRLGPPADGERGDLAARPVRGLDRPAVLRAVGQCAAAAGLVRARRSSARAATHISSTPRAMSAASSRCSAIRSCRAVLPARPADPCLVGRVLWADRADRRLRRAVLALRPPAGEPRPSRQRPTRGRPGATPRSGWRSPRSRPALLIAVTAHLSTDIAPSPFLWVIPLALYLLTFVIVFQQTPIIPASPRGAGPADPAGRAGRHDRATPSTTICRSSCCCTWWRSSSPRWCAMASWRGAGRPPAISRRSTCGCRPAG